MPKVALQADLWYNDEVNIVVSEDAVNIAQTLIHLIRRCIVDSIPSDIPHKQCSNPDCCQYLPATVEFFYAAKTRDGLSGRCKECIKKQANTRYQQPEAREKKRSYRQKPEVKEKDKEAKRKLYQREEVKEKHRQYQRQRYHQPEIRARVLEYSRQPDVQKKHAENMRKYSRQPEYKIKSREYQREYRSRPEGREKKRIQYANHQARKKAIAGSYTSQQIQGKLKAQKHKCYYCSIKFDKKGNRYIYHVDHTFPISRVTGTDIPANDISYLVLTCPHCNTSKGNKFPWEWPEGGRLL